MVYIGLCHICKNKNTKYKISSTMACPSTLGPNEMCIFLQGYAISIAQHITGPNVLSFKKRNRLGYNYNFDLFHIGRCLF